MKTTYLKAKYQFKQFDVDIPQIGKDDVLLKVKACGFCGHEMILARYAAEDWTPFGHEISGVVEKVGEAVTNLKVGDHVVVETSTFDPCSAAARNGHPELDGLGEPDLINYIGTRDVMGFSEYTAVPAALCVKFETMSFEEGALIEPFGVAMDLFKTSQVELGDDVLVIGLGAIGLMTLQLVKRAGARHVYAAGTSRSPKKNELALKLGADKVFLTDKEDLKSLKFPRGGVDKILVTAPPSVIPDATHLMNLGGILSFIGIAYGEAAMFTLDSNVVHHKKMQIRASDAVPALYFPLCIDLVESGQIDLKSLISHTFPLENAIEGLKDFIDHPADGVKAVMVQP